MISHFFFFQYRIQFSVAARWGNRFIRTAKIGQRHSSFGNNGTITLRGSHSRLNVLGEQLLELYSFLYGACFDFPEERIG